MTTLERIDATPELAGFPLASRVILAIALEEERPLRPVTVELDREILFRAEHLVRREGMAPRAALERARGEAPRNALERAHVKEIDVATLRGALRFARALLEDDDVRRRPRS